VAGIWRQNCHRLEKTVVWRQTELEMMVAGISNWRQNCHQLEKDVEARRETKLEMEIEVAGRRHARIKEKEKKEKTEGKERKEEEKMMQEEKMQENTKERKRC